jgi:transcription elongation GreA/GreB family factor
MQEDIYILEHDKEYARRRILELEAEIQGLGPEFYDVFNQSSETWHDNAPFDALRDRQAVLVAELAGLKRALAAALPSIPKARKGTISIGSRVVVRNQQNDKVATYYIAGDWTPHAGSVRDEAIVISRRSPLAEAICGKKVGDIATFKHPLVIEALSSE